ncbi:MAG: hypothetical protein AAB019_08360 [Planctomycetota bacterium]
MKNKKPIRRKGAGRCGRPPKSVSLSQNKKSVWFKRFIKPSRELFGEVAVRMEFVTKRDVQAALKVQQQLRQRGRNKLIGLIMMEMGLLSTTQLIAVLKELELKESI